MSLVIVSLQFLIISFFVRDRNIVLCSFWLSLVFLLQYFTIGLGDYYFRHTLFDLTSLFIVGLFCQGYKRLFLYIIIICSLLMNIYEGLSYYQTIIYPYRDIIQWWMVEIMFIVLAWNCNWRGIGYVKLRRNSLQR